MSQYVLKYNPRKYFSTNYSITKVIIIIIIIIIIIVIIQLNLSTTANLGTEESSLGGEPGWPLWGGGGVI